MPIPAASSLLAAPDDLAAYLGETFDADATTRAQQALGIASAIVREATGREWSAGTHTAYLSSTSQWLTVPAGATVTAVSLDGTAVTDYEVVGGRLFRYAGWTAYGTGAPVASVTYTTDGTVPDDVLGAVLALAADLYENPRGLSSEAIDDYTWRSSGSDEGSLAESRLAAVRRAYRRRPLTVPIQ